MTEPDFLRARSPEQQELRRAQVLAAARTLLDESPSADISLRELARVVGLSKSNVVRYFPTREAVFLAVLAEDAHRWLDDAEQRLGPRRGRPSRTAHARTAAAVVGALAAQPRLCGLIAASQVVLETNIPVDTAREYKTEVLAVLERLAALVARSTGLAEAAAFESATYVWVLAAGAWPSGSASPAVAEVLAEPAFARLRYDFEPAMTRALTVVLDGLAAEQAVSRPAR